ncbi:MAG: tRNA (adenosine(37)-N6)-threonylcarbamoyltransferase complex dimerization subunit type 1 TsaB [Crocinitomicaceae bacterium]|nr:tRNA (adenosine(37)-N6)-threonylcarbamoyltransferase complex dimerization subunit type 1 TsaB [Flavobacteriales bacterium]NQZ34452.1 tRNA (adenosine(37)-N6)-threonylcarbamoyltransferase complex dimerization subunit type 1 TsaB [Crocinitomicaceae bacterium]
MAFLLHLETSTKVCSVALSKDGQLCATEELEEDGYSHGENLTLFIQRVLEKERISINELNGVSVASGPGSYTGLRIGVATAKGLCYSLKIPLIAIDSLTALAAQVSSDVTKCAVIDARRMEVYNCFFDAQGNKLKEISADIIDEDSYREFEPFIYFGDGAKKLEDTWSNRDCEINTTIKSSAIGQVKIAFEKFNKAEFEDVAYFEPFYLKDFIAGKKKA